MAGQAARVGKEGIIDVQAPLGVTISPPGIPSVKADGFSIAVFGSAIPAHGTHLASTINGGSNSVFAGGVRVARIGDLTTDTGTPALVNVVPTASTIFVGD